MQGEYALYIDGRFITGGGRLINTLYSEQQPDAHATGAPETAA